MATTLADINKQLIEQNDTLIGVGKEIGKVSSGLEAFLRNMASDRMDQLERDREAAAQQRQEQQAEKNRAVSEKPGPSGKGLFGDMFENIKGGLGLGTGAGLVAALGGFLLKRGLPAILANVFADEIADFIESETGSAELGDAVHRALKLGSFGLLLGKRFGMFGAVIGALLTPENQTKLEKLGINLEEAGEKVEKFFGISLPTLSELGTWLTGTFGNALDFINAALERSSLETDEDLEKNANELSSKLKDFGATIGLLAFALSPRGTIALALGTITGAFGLAKKSIKDLAKIAGLTATGLFTSATQKSKVNAANLADIKNLTADQTSALGKQGAFVKGGKLVDLYGNELSVADTRSKLSGIGLESPFDEAMKKSKYAKNFGFLKKIASKVPLVGTLITSGLLASILLDDTLSEQDKAKQVGGLFGGVVGSVALGAIGGMLFGPAGLVGGSILGGLSGEAFGEWLLGIKNPEGVLGRQPSKIKRTSSMSGTYEQDRERKRLEQILGRQIDMTSPEFAPRGGAPGVAIPQPTLGYDITQMANEFAARSAQPIVIAGGDTNVVQGGTTNTQEIAIGGPTPMFALRDYLDQGRN